MTVCGRSVSRCSSSPSLRARSSPSSSRPTRWRYSPTSSTNDERRAIAERFFEQVEEGKSLAFFYVDERNPLFIEDGERSPHRVLVGISRIESYEKEIRQWSETTYGGETNMVWSVPFKHSYPKDGVRLPVQAIQSAVADPEERAQYLVPLEGGIRTDFRYGSSRVSLDRSVAVIERAIAALGRVRADGVIETSVEHELEWLNSILLELWEDRGPYPGIAPLLTMMGCSRAAEIASKALGAVAADGRDAAEVLFAALDGEVDEALADFEDEVGEAADEWEYWDESERELARLLVRMELETDQIKLIAGSPDNRERHDLPRDAAEITANPYLMCERFQPLRDGEPISFLTVDHGLVPHESMAPLGEHRVHRRDPRRLRALLCEELSAKAEDGHTFLNAGDALAAATARSPEDRQCDVPLDRLSHEKVAPTLEHAMERFEIDGEPQLALHEIRECEKQIKNSFDELVARPPNDSPGGDWQEFSDRLAEESGDPRVELSDEQRDALERTFRSPLSVLTGAAGTGKSTELAHGIITTQTSEIRQIRQLHERIFGAAVLPNEDAHAALGLSAEEAGMAHMDSGALKRADPFDRAFIDAMIPHHQGAIRMASSVLGKTEFAGVRELAKTIVSAQSREIGQMNRWRRAWYGARSPAGGVPEKGEAMGEGAGGEHDGH